MSDDNQKRKTCACKRIECEKYTSLCHKEICNFWRNNYKFFDKNYKQ